MFYYSAMLYNVHKHGKKRPLFLFDPCANLFRKQKDIEIRPAHSDAALTPPSNIWR
jgi:hypothetical protein